MNRSVEGSKSLKGPKFTADEKIAFFKAFIRQFEKEIQTLTESAKAAHEAATHEESKAEDSHDTRGLEASYLAGAQANRIGELKDVIQHYRGLLDTQSKPVDEVASGAFICLQLLKDGKAGSQGAAKGQPILALYAAKGGGTTIESPYGVISVISPYSPIGEILMGAVAGDVLSLESKAGDRFYRVESVS